MTPHFDAADLEVQNTSFPEHLHNDEPPSQENGLQREYMEVSTLTSS
jgi:hypothetical protein